MAGFSKGSGRAVPPLYNDAFVRVFGSAGSARVATALANAALRGVGLPEVGPAESVRADAAGAGGVGVRGARYDVVLVADGGGRVVDLEAQRRHADVGNKALFYACKLLCEHAPRGDNRDYASMPQVAVITLLEGRRLSDDGCFASACTLVWDRGGRLEPGPGGIALVAVELDKVSSRYTGGDGGPLDELAAWCRVLSGAPDDEEMEAIVSRFPTIEEFAEMYGMAAGDPELKRSYDLYYESELELGQMRLEARLEGLAEGRDEGRAEGLAEGLAEGRDRLAARLRELGVDEGVLELALAEGD